MARSTPPCKPVAAAPETASSPHPACRCPSPTPSTPARLSIVLIDHRLAAVVVARRARSITLARSRACSPPPAAPAPGRTKLAGHPRTSTFTRHRTPPSSSTSSPLVFHQPTACSGHPATLAVKMMPSSSAYEPRSHDMGRNKKQSMAELKLRRLNELNARLKEDLDRRRIPVSEAANEYVLP